MKVILTAAMILISSTAQAGWGDMIVGAILANDENAIERVEKECRVKYKEELKFLRCFHTRVMELTK